MQSIDWDRDGNYGTEIVNDILSTSVDMKGEGELNSIITDQCTSTLNNTNDKYLPLVGSEVNTWAKTKVLVSDGINPPCEIFTGDIIDIDSNYNDTKVSISTGDMLEVLKEKDADDIFYYDEKKENIIKWWLDGDFKRGGDGEWFYKKYADSSLWESEGYPSYDDYKSDSNSSYTTEVWQGVGINWEDENIDDTNQLINYSFDGMKLFDAIKLIVESEWGQFYFSNGNFHFRAETTSSGNTTDVVHTFYSDDQVSDPNTETLIEEFDENVSSKELYNEVEVKSKPYSVLSERPIWTGYSSNENHTILMKYSDIVDRELNMSDKLVNLPIKDSGFSIADNSANEYRIIETVDKISGALPSLPNEDEYPDGCYVYTDKSNGYELYQNDGGTWVEDTSTKCLLEVKTSSGIAVFSKGVDTTLVDNLNINYNYNPGATLINDKNEITIELDNPITNLISPFDVESDYDFLAKRYNYSADLDYDTHSENNYSEYLYDRSADEDDNNKITEVTYTTTIQDYLNDNNIDNCDGIWKVDFTFKINAHMWEDHKWHSWELLNFRQKEFYGVVEKKPAGASSSKWEKIWSIDKHLEKKSRDFETDYFEKTLIIPLTDPSQEWDIRVNTEKVDRDSHTSSGFIKTYDILEHSMTSYTVQYDHGEGAEAVNNSDYNYDFKLYDNRKKIKLTFENNSPYDLVPYAINEEGEKQENLFLKGKTIVQEDEYKFVAIDEQSKEDNNLTKRLTIENDLICKGVTIDGDSDVSQQEQRKKQVDDNNDKVENISKFLLNKYSYPKSILKIKPITSLPHLEIKDRVRVKHQENWDRNYFIEGVNHNFTEEGDWEVQYDLKEDTVSDFEPPSQNNDKKLDTERKLESIKNVNAIPIETSMNGNNKVLISWDKQYSDLLFGYKIYRRLVGNVIWNDIGNIEKKTNEYIDTSVSFNKNYEYLVRGYSLSDEHTPVKEGSTDSVTTKKTNSPLPPVFLNGNSIFTDELFLSWEQYNNNFQSFELRRDLNWGVNDENLIQRDKTSTYRNKTPGQREIDYYLKVINDNGIYSNEYAEISLNNPQPNQPPKPVVKESFEKIWITPQPVDGDNLEPEEVSSLPTLPDSNYPIGTILLLTSDGNHYINNDKTWYTTNIDNDIIGYKIYITKKEEDITYTQDTQTNLINEGQPEVIDLKSPQKITYTGKEGETYLIQVTAYDILGEGVASNYEEVSTADSDGIAAFARRLEKPDVVDNLPNLPNEEYPIGRYVFLTSDRKIYKNINNKKWKNDLDATDQLIVGAVQAGAIGADEVDANELYAEHIDTDELLVEESAQIADATIDNAHITNMSGNKIEIGSTPKSAFDGSTQSDIADGVTANDETIQYRKQGSPTNQVTPIDVTTEKNTNGTLDIKVEWDKYTQGDKKADFIMLFWDKGTISAGWEETQGLDETTQIYDEASPVEYEGTESVKYLFNDFFDTNVIEDNEYPTSVADKEYEISNFLGAPNENDSVTTFNVNTFDPSYYTLEGVSADKFYSFGLGASRKTENGLETTKIQQVDGIVYDKSHTNADYSPISAGGGAVEIDKNGIKGTDGTKTTFEINTDGSANLDGKVSTTDNGILLSELHKNSYGGYLSLFDGADTHVATIGASEEDTTTKQGGLLNLSGGEGNNKIPLGTFGISDLNTSGYGELKLKSDNNITTVDISAGFGVGSIKVGNDSEPDNIELNGATGRVTSKQIYTGDITFTTDSGTATVQINPGSTNGEIKVGDTYTTDKIELLGDNGQINCNELMVGESGIDFEKQANGYTKLVNGLILQWGRTQSYSGDANDTIYFPTSFPTNCLQVTASAYGSRTNIAGSSYVIIDSISADSFNSHLNDASGCRVMWMAIGY